MKRMHCRRDQNRNRNSNRKSRDSRCKMNGDNNKNIKANKVN